MSIRIDVKKFAKIEYASVETGDFLLLVGDNNSGKTLMMELIYAIIDKMSDWPLGIDGDKITEMGGTTFIQFSSEWFAKIEQSFNDYLKISKDKFIVECFSKDIPVEEITIHFEETKNVFYIGTIAETADLDKQLADGVRVNIASNITGSSDELKLRLAKYALLDALGLSDRKNQIFLPAARAGLQMLYRDYFANAPGRSGLALPIYEFLKFLQLYSPRVQFEDSEKEMIEFIDRELLSGTIEYRDGEFTYKEGSHFIPLNMASSMIHELSSLSSVLKSEKKYGYIYYDEAENSIHPIMQGNLARALIRLCNHNIKIIVSTHSDTLAGKINNLILVSRIRNVTQRNGIVEKLKLNMQDMLETHKTIHVYEFKKDENGKVFVEELDFMAYPKIGYEFERFNENIDNLYDESNYIMGYDENTEAEE